MRRCLIISALSLAATVDVSPRAAYQTAPQSRVAAAPKAQSGAAKAQPGTHVDLAGNWGYMIGVSFSPKGGAMDAGTPRDGVPYQPWALEKFKSRNARAGPTATDATRVGPDLQTVSETDPLEQCDPNGVPRILTWPQKMKFVQTPDIVYIVYETGPFWRQVRLNAKHPEDLDPSWWGHSIGWYEGSDTLVVDTIGLNDKTWLDDTGRPHTDKLHVIERYRRADRDHLEVTLTIDDPGAYTATWSYGPKTLLRRTTEFGKQLWICTAEENKGFFNNVVEPTLTK